MAFGLEDIVSLLAKGQITPETAAILRSRIPSVPDLRVGAGAFGNPTSVSVGQPAAPAATPIPLAQPTPAAPPVDTSALPPGSDDWMSRADAGKIPVQARRPSPTTPPVGTPIPGSALNKDSATAAPVPTPSPTESANDLIQKGYDAQSIAVADARLGAAQAQTGLVGETIKQAKMLEDARKEEERFQAEKQKRLDDGQAVYKQALDDLNAQKIEPNRLYANQSTGDKIIAAIGIALGGIASGMTGQKNSALEIIQNAIDRDIEAQKIEVEKKSKNVAVQGSLYNDLVGRLQNEDAARHYMTSLLLQQSSSLIDQYKTQVSSAQQAATLGKLQGEIMVQKGQAEQKAQEDLAKDPAQQQAIRAGVLGNKIDPSNLSKEDRERYVPSLNSFARDKTQAEVIENAKSNYDDAVSLIDQIINERQGLKDKSGKEIVHGVGAEVLDSDAIARQTTRAGELQSAVKEIEKLGALSGSDYTLLYSQVPKDPTAFTRSQIPLVGGFFGDSIVSTLKQLKHDLTNKFQRDINKLTEKSPEATNLSTQLNLTPR